MRSTVSIYNIALARLGGHQLERVNSPDDDSATSTLCRTLFPAVVDLALASCEWSFATVRVELARKPEGGAAGYPYRYGLPTNCLYPLRLEGAGADGFTPEYILEGLDLLTAKAPAVLAYVRQAHDPAEWSAPFADAVAWGLAGELATALINDARRQQFYLQKYESALQEARRADLRRQRLSKHVSPWLAARG